MGPLHTSLPITDLIHSHGLLAGRELARVTVRQPELAHGEPAGFPGPRVLAASHSGPRGGQELG